MRKRVLCGVVSLLGLVLAPRMAGAAPEWVEGDWIGALDGRDGTLYIAAHFREEQGRIAGSLEFPLKSDGALDMEGVKIGEGSVTFEVRSPGANLLFEGGRRDDGRVTGSVRRAYASSRFELVKLTTLAPERLDAVAGNYEIEPGHVVLIARKGESLMYVDAKAGRLGMLYAIGDRTLIAGPTVGSGYPVELTISLPEAGDGPVQTLTWQRRNRPPLRAVRRTLYRTEQLGFYNGSIRLSASLVLPPGPGPHPAIVMVHGSGPATRDSLRPWADVYARAGFAVLIHDKRGSGASTGNWARATFDDLAGDALAAMAYLRSRAEINPAQIGLHGMSLGSWVAPLAASRSGGRVAFVIAESASALSPVEHERLRVEHQLRADGFPRDVIVRALAFMDRKFEVAKTGEGWESLADPVERAGREGWAAYVNPPQTLESLQWHWQHVLSYDPVPALKALSCPVLVLYGGLDSIVPAEVNRARMEAALGTSRTRDVTFRVFERANHSFLEAETGGRREAPSLRGFVAGYLDTHVAWLGPRVPRGAGFAAAAGAGHDLGGGVAVDGALDSLLPYLAVPTGDAPSYLPRARQP
jgi:dienelactone hydrolase